MSGLFALKVDDPIQHLCGMSYAGAAIAAAFCGDLISLFVFWELTALTSVFLIWASRTESSTRTGVRYLIVQVASGVILLAGALIHYQETKSLEFTNFFEAGMMTRGAWWMFWAIGIKAAFPLLHNWLQDAYPKATYSGTVFLSAFTTKLAIYALARGYAGNDFLIPIGCVMTCFPIFFAVIENDLRKVLAYSLNNQLGFMVVGIGVGTELAINGACAHAFAHIIYKGLLFMSMGAVLYRTGTTKASELGGLHRTMPFTTVFCIIGAMSISAFPLLSGFAAKSLITSAVGYEGMIVVTFVLLFASAGVMEHSGIKIPFFAFFAHDSGKRPKEAPWNMLLAMGMAAALCIGIGVAPQSLYALLPYPTDYNAYDFTHVVTQFELLLFAALAFGLLLKMGVYPAELKSVNLDFDWFYRRLIPNFIKGTLSLLGDVGKAAMQPIMMRLAVPMTKIQGLIGGGKLASEDGAQSGDSALWAALMLCGFLLLFYV
jgi:multicomponent Na+:H+ antiporter subunit D